MITIPTLFIVLLVIVAVAGLAFGFIRDKKILIFIALAILLLVWMTLTNESIVLK